MYHTRTNTGTSPEILLEITLPILPEILTAIFQRILRRVSPEIVQEILQPSNAKLGFDLQFLAITIVEIIFLFI